MTNNKNSTLKKTFISSHQLTLPEHNNLIVIRGDYNNQLYSHGLFDLYNISCPDSIKKSVVKRQAEYLAGRYCAKEALEILAPPAIEITSGQHRNPIWPFNITGSIAHTSATAYAAVGYSNDYCRIGIDYETILSPHTAKNLFFSIVSETEREHLLTWPMDFEYALTLAFSAKESLFKALYPEVRQYFDFSDAEIYGLCDNQNRFSIRLMHSLSSDLPKGSSFEGHYQFSEQSVLTVIADKRT